MVKCSRMATENSEEIVGKAKRKPPAAGKGRPKGALNKVPKQYKISARERVDEVDAELTEAGQGLAVQAKLNPQWFYEKVWVKILPKPVEVSGSDGGPIQIALTERLTKALERTG